MTAWSSFPSGPKANSSCRRFSRRAGPSSEQPKSSSPSAASGVNPASIRRSDGNASRTSSTSDSRITVVPPGGDHTAARWAVLRKGAKPTQARIVRAVSRTSSAEAANQATGWRLSRNGVIRCRCSTTYSHAQYSETASRIRRVASGQRDRARAAVIPTSMPPRAAWRFSATIWPSSWTISARLGSHRLTRDSAQAGYCLIVRQPITDTRSLRLPSRPVGRTQ